jgi:Cdc6-like AAA superfamily ATPase
VSDRRKRLAATGGESEPARGRSLSAGQRTADQLLNAVRDLRRMQGSMRHYHDGRAIDPIGLIAEAAARRSGDADTVLALLERWAGEARRRVAGTGGPGDVNC